MNTKTIKKRPQILLVEDSQSHAMIYLDYLSKGDWDVTHVETGGDGLMFVKQTPPSLVLLDLELPDIHGMAILRYIVENQLPCSVVIITGHGTIDTAVEAMQAGAFDFLSKPFDTQRLTTTVENALEHARLQMQPWLHKDEFHDSQYYGFVGASQVMQKLYQTIDKMAPSKASVFICGESGTGKELCARAIHDSSPRANKPFIALNCASIPQELMESEFFGHVKGAFTGAHTEREGAVALADGGTLFLDEICEMDLNLQTKLLRFIQTGAYRKVGSDKERRVDIRFVCATNRSPLEEVTKGHFREDLYYRLHVLPINMPPLRERGTDILLLAKAFLSRYGAEENKKFTGFTAETEDIFLKYQWPGNIREIQNTIRIITVMCSDSVIEATQLPATILNSVGQQSASQASSSAVEPLRAHSASVLPFPSQNANHELAQSLPCEDGYTTSIANIASVDKAQCEVAALVLEEHVQLNDKAQIKPFGVYERKIIEAAIEQCEGNVPEAAAHLALSPSTLYRKIQNWRTDKR